MQTNELVEYNIKKDESRNKRVQENNEQISETKREAVKTISDPKDIESTKSKPLSDIICNFFKTKKKIWMPVMIVLLVGIILGIAVPIALKNKNKNKGKNTPNEEVIIQNNVINMEEAKVIFSPSFKINSKVDTLTQLSQKFLQKYETETKDEKTKMLILNKAVYDIYTLNSTSSSKEDKYFYTNLYTTVITVNSLCAKSSFDSAEVDCNLEQYLDLNKRESNNLRRNEEENEEELLKSAIIPLCIVEHTDTNLIISLTCPKTLEESFKNDIIRAFQNIKPDSTKGYEFDKSYVDTFSEEKDNKIYTTSFDNICKEPNTDPNKIIICNLTKNIVTDKEGNLISTKTTTSEKTTKDENNIYINSFLSEYENIPKEKSSSFNQEIFKSNLNSFLPKINFLMEKEIFISNFTDFAIDIMTEEEPQNKTKLRFLSEQAMTSRGVHEENIFNEDLSSDVSVFFNLKNDIGLNDGKNTKAMSAHNVNEENITQLSGFEYVTNLNETLNKFIILSKSGNILANKLYKELNEPLLKLGDIITKNIEKINNILANKNLLEIFDSTLAIKQLDSLNYEFVVETENLYNSMNELSTNLLYTINTAKEILKKDVSDFLTESHNLMYKLFNKLTEASNVLSSDKSKMAEISSYYLNNTDESYYEFIQNASNILNNYYINEAELITQKVNPMLENFYSNVAKIVAKCQDDLDEINERLNSGDLTIVHSTNEVYQKVIKNIYNTKLKANEIIKTVRDKFQESINLQNNGYFETNKEIEENNKTYNQVCERALSISYALDKNELIDKTFDTVWTSFRDKFIDILEYMENSINNKFPLQENVLTSLFDGTYKADLNTFFTNEKKTILDNINNENKEYLSKVNKKLSSFKGENDKSLDQIISELLNQLTAIKLDNLNNTFNDSLTLAFKSITKIIENNKNNALEYLNDNKIANSYHITTGFINKYNTFYNSVQNIENFVNNNLKNNLAIKYKNVVNQIRAQLQSIKSNKILEKYYKQLSTAENHLNSIKDLFNIFGKRFSDSIFNNDFLPAINLFIEGTNNNTKQIKQKFESIYNNIAKKGKNNILKDYDVERVVIGSTYCCKRYWWGSCKRYCKNPDTYYYDGYNVQSTNNSLNLTQINFESYITIFDEEYTQLYSKLSNNVLSYNSLLSNLDTIIETQKDEYLSADISYLQSIPQKIDTILEQKYGDVLLQSSYNYFKNKITNTLPNELNDIMNKWSSAYDEIYDELNTNKNNFKSSLEEFLYMPRFYISTYTLNISYDYGETVVEKLKNEFIYTNKYYYNSLISNISQTYSYILNNLPNNEKPFDEILNIRKSEIKKIYENILKKINNSKNDVLDTDKQKSLLQINDNNFFKINDIISNHIKYFETAMNAKMDSISSVVQEILNECPEELMAAKFYLENSINGKHVKKLYSSINTDSSTTFVDLQRNVYEKLIDDVWNIDKGGLVLNINYTLIELNKKHNNDFKYEKADYIKILEDKLFSEFYTKENLDKKIISFYSEAIISSVNIPKNQIYNIINAILDKIKMYIKDEEKRINDTLTSYSTVFTKIKTRLNNYKADIYEQIYSTITYVVNDIHEKVLEKFYSNFILKGLNEYREYINKTDFGSAQFLNMSINLNEILKKEANLIISEYNNLTINQIEFLFQKNLEILNQKYNFSEIKLKINKEIDNAYNNQLLLVLKNKSIYNSGDEGVEDYDFSSDIIDNIDAYINKSIGDIKKLIKQTEGNQNLLKNISVADFSITKENVYNKIKERFQSFSLSNINEESKEFVQKVGDIIVNTFNSFINNFVPSFGVDFFKRIITFNEIQKVKLLYHNLQYNLAQTNSYYVILATLYDNFRLPQDIKLKLLTFNNLEEIINTKNNLIILDINKALDEFFEETKTYIVNKYIVELDTCTDFDINFNTNIKDTIKKLNKVKESVYQKEYIDMMEKNIKNIFVNEYTSILTSSTNIMKDFIDRGKIELKVEIDNIFTLNSDSVLVNINKILNETSLAEKEYKNHFEIFNISKEVIVFLNNFGRDFIELRYKNIKDLLNKNTVELVINNLENLSNIFINEYSIDNFKSEINKVNQNFSTYFNNFTKILDDYGHIESIYSENLNKEKSKLNGRLRRLDEENKFSDLKLEQTFTELKRTSSLIKNLIENLDLFTNFEEKIDKYKYDKSQQICNTSSLLENNKEKNSNYDVMYEKYVELSNLSTEYYTEAEDVYKTMKEELFTNINKINNFLISCEEVTYDTIINEYNKLKDEFNGIEETQDKTNEQILIPVSTFNKTDSYITMETTIQNYLVHNKITVDLLYDNDSKTPKVIGRLENNVKPNIFNIDYYSTFGGKDKIGKIIEVNFNKISSYTNITFDSSFNNLSIVTNFNFDKYKYKTQYYEKTTNSTIKKIFGIPTIVNVTIVSYNKTLEENIDIDPKNKTIVENYIF